MLIEQAHQKNVIFFTFGGFKYEPSLCNSCHDLMKSYEFY